MSKDNFGHNCPLTTLYLQPPIHKYVRRHDPVIERVSLQDDEIC